jgi:hypothetical protein
MGDGQAAGLFGVIGKIALGIEIGIVSDDFDGTFVGADGSVRTKTPELAAIGS